MLTHLFANRGFPTLFTKKSLFDNEGEYCASRKYIILTPITGVSLITQISAHANVDCRKREPILERVMSFRI